MAIYSSPLPTRILLPRVGSISSGRASKHAHRTLATLTAPPAAPVEVPQYANALLTPYQMGQFELSHRMVLAPLTRNRALGTIPQPQAAKYYAQRTTKGGFLISEATVVAVEGHGYPDTPGIYTPEHIEAWKPITAAVQDAGGVFFSQLYHVGRASHPEYQPNGALPISSSAVPISNGEKVYTPSWQEADYGMPRALDASEIPRIVQQFADAARSSLAAGFQGTEIHGANGYIIDQFLKASVNKRTDAYGGSIPNRARFALEVAAAVADAIGPDLVGFRVSPFSDFLDATDPETLDLNLYLADKLSDMGLLYFHAVEPRVSGITDVDGPVLESLEPLRAAFKGTFIAAGGYKRESGIHAIESGHADLIGYGRLFLANPDLPLRYALDAPLNKYNRNTFYSPNQTVGYTDYPFLDRH